MTKLKIAVVAASVAALPLLPSKAMAADRPCEESVQVCAPHCQIWWDESVYDSDIIPVYPTPVLHCDT